MWSWFPRTWNPNTSSIQTRYIQPAEPVYQVQPLAPARSGDAETSAATAYGSPRYAETMPGSFVRSTGLIICNNRTAAAPWPILARACASQMAAWVYCPPFSLVPGGYPWIYPGCGCDVSKGGARSNTIPSLGLTRSDSALSMPRRILSWFSPPASTAHDCARESMRASLFAWEPSGDPSSKNPRTYQSPSQADRSTAAASSSARCFQRAARSG